MEPLGVVEVIGVPRDHASGSRGIGEDLVAHALVLEGREEALRDSVVPAVALAAHAAFDAVVLQDRHVVVGAVGAEVDPRIWTSS